jgi:hypothetical protein
VLSVTGLVICITHQSNSICYWSTCKQSFNQGCHPIKRCGLLALLPSTTNRSNQLKCSNDKMYVLPSRTRLFLSCSASFLRASSYCTWFLKQTRRLIAVAISTGP